MNSKDEHRNSPKSKLGVPETEAENLCEDFFWKKSMPGIEPKTAVFVSKHVTPPLP